MRIELKSILTEYGHVTYRIVNADSPITLVFIHGLGGDSRLFSNQLRYFGEKFKCIAIDLPGHGRSDIDVLPDENDFLESINLIFQEENINTFIIFGHSMGGCICLNMFKKRKYNIKGMVLISTGAVLPVTDELYRMINGDLENFIDFLVGATFSQNAALLSEFAKSRMSNKVIKILRNDLEICNRMNYSDILETIDIPVLIIANERDKIVKAHITASLKEKIANSKYIEYDFDGHVPFFENKKAFNNTVDEFLQELLVSL